MEGGREEFESLVCWIVWGCMGGLIGNVMGGKG